MKWLIIAAALLLLVWGGVAEVAGGNEQEKLQVIKKNLEESREKLKETREQRQEVLGKLVVITQELRQANKKLNRAKSKIQENVSKIGELTVELKKTEEELQQKTSVLSRRVREAYKSGGVSYLNILLASNSMSDFLSRFYYFEKIIGRDARLIAGVKADMEVTQSDRQTLSQRNTEIKELAQVITEEKDKISEQAAEKAKALAQLKEREAEYAKKVAELEKSSQELEVMIQRKIAERSRAGLTAKGTGLMTWPLNGRITLRFGARHRLQGRHTGLDIAAPYGSPIAAADSGVVIFAGWWDGYGKAIVIDHGKGRATVYAHQSRLYVGVNTTVIKGQTIGLVGSTGYSTGPHLHFEVRKNGVPQNPEKYLP